MLTCPWGSGKLTRFHEKKVAIRVLFGILVIMELHELSAQYHHIHQAAHGKSRGGRKLSLDIQGVIEYTSMESRLPLLSQVVSDAGFKF
jgi:hypothetical protein